MSVKNLLQCFVALGLLAVPAVSANAQYAQTRDGFWFSGGLGYGSVGCQDCGVRVGGVSGGLSLGGTISPRFLLGVGTSGFVRSQDGITLSVSTLDARVRFYPVTASGFFLTGGLGLGSASAVWVGHGSDTQVGAGAVLGLGWDIRVARNASITPFWSSFAMANSNMDADVGQIGLAVTLH